MTVGDLTDRMVADSQLAEPGSVEYMPLPVATPVHAGERYEQAWDELRELSQENGNDKARRAQLLLWEIGMLATLRETMNAIPAEIRAEREPEIQARRQERATRASQAATPLSWDEWQAKREDRLRELSDWETEMANIFMETRSYIPQSVQEDRDRHLSVRYEARRRERDQIAADWLTRNAAA